MDVIREHKWRLIALAGLLLSLLLILEDIVPEIGKTSALIGQLRDQRRKIESVQNWESRLDRLQKRRDHLKQFFSKIYVSFPRDDQMSAIVSLIYSLASQSGVRLQQMQPGKQAEHKSYVEIPITLDMEGSYLKIGRFVNLVEQSKYLIQIKQLHMKPDEKQRAGLQTRISLQIIILSNDALQAKETKGKQSDSHA